MPIKKLQMCVIYVTPGFNGCTTKITQMIKNHEIRTNIVIYKWCKTLFMSTVVHVQTNTSTPWFLLFKIKRQLSYLFQDMAKMLFLTVNFVMIGHSHKTVLLVRKHNLTLHLEQNVSVWFFTHNPQRPLPGIFSGKCCCCLPTSP